METQKLNIGSGRIVIAGYVNIDYTQVVGSNGKETVAVVMDIERERLPYDDNTIDEIRIDNTLEHIGFHRDNPDELEALIFVMNECHRVLKPSGIIRGNVPPANSNGALRDPTHKRQFVKETFDYFTGQNEALPAQPGHPKYANYGIKPWYKIFVDDGIKFILRPRKTIAYNSQMEQYEDAHL